MTNESIGVVDALKVALECFQHVNVSGYANVLPMARGLDYLTQSISVLEKSKAVATEEPEVQPEQSTETE